MNADDRILRNPRVALAPVDDGYLAYNIENSQLHRLNTAASVIVELADGTLTADAICQQVLPYVGNNDPAPLKHWIETALQDGLLKSLQPNEPVPAEPAASEFAAAAKELRRAGMVLGSFVCQHYATMQMTGDADHWLYLGELAHIIGRREDAREAYEKYMQFDPDDAEAEQILISLRDETPPPRAPDRCIEQLYARFAEFYEDNMVGDLEYQAPARLEEALSAALGPADNLRVLELGCGTGLAAPALRKRANYLYGIDLSPQMVERAKTTGLYDGLEVAEITAWLSKPAASSFDLIVACDTFIYFGDLQQVIVPATRLLRPGGWIAFTVERGDAPPFKLTDSGRYSHTEAHIRDVAEKARLHVASLAEGLLRYEYGKPVVGLVTVLRRDQA